MNIAKYRVLILALVATLLSLGSTAAYSQSGVEISTEGLKEILAGGTAHVFDVRPAKEYAISHVPGAVNIYEKETDRILRLCPDRTMGIVLYCNGPYCHKSIRVAEQLAAKGYLNVKRYQLGMPVWRAFGNTAETDLSGFQYVFSTDRSAVLVDARPLSEFEAGTVARAVHIEAGRADAANKDGRLPYYDHGTRIIVFGSSAEQARRLAEEIAHRAYWNSSYFSGTYTELKRAGFW